MRTELKRCCKKEGTYLVVTDLCGGEYKGRELHAYNYYRYDSKWHMLQDLKLYPLAYYNSGYLEAIYFGDTNITEEFLYKTFYGDYELKPEYRPIDRDSVKWKAPKPNSGFKTFDGLRF